MKRKLLNAPLMLILMALTFTSQASDSRLDETCQLEVKEKREVTIKDIVENEGDITHPLLRAPFDKYGFGSVVQNTRDYLNARGGVDLVTTPGMGVIAMANAEVKNVGYWFAGSFAITAELENGKTIRYGFLKHVTVKAGDVITKGQLLGTVASSRMDRSKERGRLRIEIFDGSSQIGLTVRKPCINRRDDVLNPEALLDSLEEKLL